MNELAAKLEAKIADLAAKQDVALAAADADEVTEEDRAKHLGEFDRLQVEKVKAKESYTRAVQAQNDKREVDATKTQPAVAPLVSQISHNPNLNSPRIIPAAMPRRRANLKAFKGPDAELRAYQSGLWVMATVHQNQAAKTEYESKFGPLAITQSTTSNTGAAYFVPDVMDYEIVRLTEEYGVARRLCRKKTMTSDTWMGPRWTGTLTAYFVAEGSAPTQSDPTYDAISLTAKNLAAKGKMSRNLQEDSVVDIGDEYAAAAAIAFSRVEDDCLFNGTGTSTYGGITGLFAKITASANSAGLSTATGHTTLASLTLPDYWAAVGLLANFPGITPSWYCHKEVYAGSMGPLQTAAGGATVAEIAAGGKPMFLGYPVEFVNVAPRASTVTTGVTGILFGDLSIAAMFGDRRQRTFEVGMENDDFSKQLITLLATERFDINCHTIVDPKDSTKPGPIVGLKLG